MKVLYIVGRDVIPEGFQLGEDESLDLCFLALPGVSAKLDIKLDIVGPGASANVSGLYICGGDERLAINVDVFHRSGGSQSNQLIRGVVGGHAHTDFNGRIVVEQDAQKTEAYQSNHNLLLSETAVVGTKPQLEIYADDVKCSHGATVGKLNDDEQFYMRSRGITEKEARKLQILSFVSPVLDAVEDEDVKEMVINAVGQLAM